MKKYLVFLFLSLCLSNFNANSKEIEVELSNTKLLNYSCIGSYSTCFCKHSTGIFTKYIGNKIDTKNICGDGNELISYGEYLELGGEPKHLSSGWQGLTDSSEAYITYENFFLEFEPKTLKIFSKENNSTFLFCLYDTGEVKEFSSNSLNCGDFSEKISFKDYQDYRSGKKYRTILESPDALSEVYNNRFAFNNGDMTKKEYDKRLKEIFKQEEKKTEVINQSSQKIDVVQEEVTLVQLDKKSLKKELEYWKELFEDELITQAEYDAKRKELLNQPITKTKVNSNKNINNNSNQTKKVSIDKSYQNKNYLYPKIEKKLFAMHTDKILRKCMGDYNKVLEQIKCSRDNIKATHRYKKQRSYFDINQLHVTSLEIIENKILSGQFSEIQAKRELAILNNNTVNQIDTRAANNKPTWNPNFDMSTGLLKDQNNNQNQNNLLNLQNEQNNYYTNTCMFNPTTNDYRICMHRVMPNQCQMFSHASCYP